MRPIFPLCLVAALALWPALTANAQSGKETKGMDMKGMDMGQCQKVHKKCMETMDKGMDMTQCMQIHGKQMPDMNMDRCMEMMDMGGKTTDAKAQGRMQKGPGAK